MSEGDAIARRPVLLSGAPFDGPLDYAVPANWPVGTILRAPLGRRESLGVLWDGEAEGKVDAAKLRPVAARADAPPLTAELRRTIDWTAAYTLSPPGQVLRMALSVPAALQPDPPKLTYVKSPKPGDGKLTEKRAAVLAVLDALPTGVGLAAAALARAADVSPAVVAQMAKTGWLNAVAESAPAGRVAAPAPPALNLDQRRTADDLAGRIGAGFSVALLDGVTGSGKTEVYLEGVAACIAAGKQAVVLSPEIALTAQMIDRFAARFGRPPALWHSEIGVAARRRVWRAAAEGRAPLIVGARSALFLPCPDLGLIVVDEEHDSSFKQEDGVCYHARDIAVLRGRMAGIPVILASATPSLESWENVARGRYDHLRLAERYGGAVRAPIAAIDLRQDRPPRDRFISETLRKATAETLAADKQALWFLNRRGYAPLTLCRACGERIGCPQCSAWLVEHRLIGRLRCHHCGYERPTPPACPACGAEDALHACGPGVERLEEEARELFPDAKIETVSSDSLRGPAQAAAFAARMRGGEIDLLIGTQIAAKGHDFRNLTLVGVVDADLGLEGGDLRAAERSFQMLEQAAGRAGRDRSAPGRALLQTASPDHPVMAALAAGDRDGFLAAESEQRRRAGMPPFARLAAIIISAPTEALADEAAAAFARSAPRLDGVRVLGPAPAPIALLRGRHRRRLLMISDRGVDAQAVLRDWRAATKTPNAARVRIDVDPQSFL